MNRTVCDLRSTDHSGVPDSRGTRPEGLRSSHRGAVRTILVGLCGVAGVLLGCGGGPHPGRAPDEPVAAALVDSCRGVGDGALCNDQNTCTVGDRCASGVCVGTLAPDGTACTDNNQCTAADLCVQGVCKGTPVPEGTLCTDGDPCTDPDTCKLGLCTSGGPATCDDGDQCTVDRCLDGEGCRHDRLVTCPDGSSTGDGATGDGAAGDAEAGTSSDGAIPDGAPVDSADADAGAADAEDAPLDGAPADLLGGDAEEADASADGPDAADAPSDGGVDVADAGSGGDGGGPDLSPFYEARGGACVCSSAPEGPPSGGLLTVAVALTLLLARRGRAGRTGDHPTCGHVSSSSVLPNDR